MTVQNLIYEKIVAQKMNNPFSEMIFLSVKREMLKGWDFNVFAKPGSIIDRAIHSFKQDVNLMKTSMVEAKNWEEMGNSNDLSNIKKVNVTW